MTMSGQVAALLTLSVLGNATARAFADAGTTAATWPAQRGLVITVDLDGWQAVANGLEQLLRAQGRRAA